MDMLNLVQNLSPAQWLVAAVLLPWMVVAAMHLASSTVHPVLDDNFMARADAVLRWKEQTPDPVDPVAGEVFEYRARSARVVAARHREPSHIEGEAA